MDTDANGDQASIKALHGITLYGNVGVGKMSNVKEPTKMIMTLSWSLVKQKYTMEKITITKKFLTIIYIIK